ncbi:MAG TPA: hypothetical protein VK674_07180 [Candidatus Limnocylindria bacterium]|nr:hypothetical protein [Candidatus Limnocylindria bacterium]
MTEGTDGLNLGQSPIGDREVQPWIEAFGSDDRAAYEGAMVARFEEHRVDATSILENALAEDRVMTPEALDWAALQIAREIVVSYEQGIQMAVENRTDVEAERVMRNFTGNWGG